MAAGAMAAPSDNLPDGIRLWQEDGGWYVAVGEQLQGPFLYRPIRTNVWEEAATTSDGNEPILARFIRFDAAAEQMTFRQDYRLDPSGQRRLVRTFLVEAPPSPGDYEGLETPAPGVGEPAR
jgi:hypothetical protein